MAAIKTQVWIYNCDSCRKEVHPSQVYMSQGKEIWTDGRDVSIYANVAVIVDKWGEGDPCICCDCAAKVLRSVADRINPPPPGITEDDL